MIRSFFLTTLALITVGCATSPNSSTDASTISGRTSVESTYTDLTLDTCEVLTLYEEGQGVELLCEGYNGIPVYVTEGDLRFDVDVGVRNSRFDSLPSFNTLGDKMEWRIRDGEAFAAIIRYHVDGSPEDVPDKTSYLAIIKTGTETQPGCTMRFVNVSDYRNANVEARIWVDQYGADFICRSKGAIAGG